MPDSRANLFWESGSHRGQYRRGGDRPLVEKLMEKGEIIDFLCTSLCAYTLPGPALFFNMIYVKEAKFKTIFFANVKNVIQGICKIFKGRAMCMVTLNCKITVK